MGFLTVVIGFVLLITIVVVVHEGGHYVLAKLSGIRVDEFAVGFGPRLLSKQIGETVYSIRALPLGGFVRMPGMLGLEGEADAGERNFYRASIPKRMITILAGIIANFILGAICLGIVSAQPSSSHVSPASPAATAGMHDGDVLVRLGLVDIDRSSQEAEFASIYRATSASQGHQVQAVIQHPDGSIATVPITPRLVLYHGSGCQRELIDVTAINGHTAAGGDPATLLSHATIDGTIELASTPDQAGSTVRGLQLGTVVNSQGTLNGSGDEASWKIGYGVGAPGQPLPQAMLTGVKRVFSFVGDTASTLAHVFVEPSCASQFSGPVGIASAAGSSLQAGWVSFLSLVGVISLSLGFVNVLPIPFLDGGRFLFVIIEAIRRRRIDPRREAAVHAVGLAVLILLFVFITIGDIHNLSAGAGR